MIFIRRRPSKLKAMSDKVSSHQQRTMKVSFSLPSTSKRTSVSSPDESHSKEFITEFDPSKSPTDSTSKKRIVIPPIPNEWNPQKHAISTHPSVKSNHSNLQFDVDTNSAVESIVSNVTYGLNLRDKKACGSDLKSLSSIDRLVLLKLKTDLKRLPEDGGLEDFVDVSVEDFAPAYLKGYGWHEGRGIGKNAKEDVKVVQYTKRTAREGLGFVRTDGADH